MLGKPVTAYLKKYKDEWVNDKGERMHYSWRIAFVKPWENGKVKTMTVSEEDLPF